MLKGIDSVVSHAHFFLENWNALRKSVVYAHLASQLFDFGVGYRLRFFKPCVHIAATAAVRENYRYHSSHPCYNRYYYLCHAVTFSHPAG